MIAPSSESKTISEDLKEKATQLDKAIDNSIAVSADSSNVMITDVAASNEITPSDNHADNTNDIASNAPLSQDNTTSAPITDSVSPGAQVSVNTTVSSDISQNEAPKISSAINDDAKNFDEMVRLLKEQQQQREKTKFKRETQYTSVLKSILKPEDTLSSVELPEANLTRSKVYQELTSQQTDQSVNLDLIYKVRDYIRMIKKIAQNRHDNHLNQNRRSASSDIEGMAALIGDLTVDSNKATEAEEQKGFMSAISSLPTFDKDGNIVSAENQNATPVEDVPFELSAQKEESKIDEKLRLAQEAAQAQLDADKELNEKLKAQAYELNSKLTSNDVDKVQSESQAPVEQMPPIEQSDFVELQDTKGAEFKDNTDNVVSVQSSPAQNESLTQDRTYTAQNENFTANAQVNNAPVANKINNEVSKLGTPLSLVLAKIHQEPEKLQGLQAHIVESTYPNSLKVVLEKVRHGNFGNTRNVADPMGLVVPSQRLKKELEALYDYEAQKVSPVKVATVPVKNIAPTTALEQKSFVPPVNTQNVNAANPSQKPPVERVNPQVQTQANGEQFNSIAVESVQRTAPVPNQVTTPQTFSTEMGVVKVQNKPTEQRSYDAIKKEQERHVIEAQYQETNDSYDEIDVEALGDDAHVYSVEDDDGNISSYTPINADALSFGNENENSLSDGDPKVMRESTLKLLNEDKQFENRRLGRKLESRDFYHLVEKSDDWLKLIHQAGYNFGDYYASLCFSTRLIDPNDQYRWILKISDDFALLMKQPDYHHNLVTKFSICMHHPVDITFAPVKGIPEGSPEDLARKFYLKEIQKERENIINNANLCQFIQTLGDDPRTVNLGLYTQQDLVNHE